MLKEVRDYGLLLEIIDHTTRLVERVSKLSRDSFLKDQDAQDVANLHILQIGELAKKLSSEFLKSHNGVDWKRIKGLRDIICHSYGSLDINKIYEICVNDVPELHNYCVEISTKEKVA